MTLNIPTHENILINILKDIFLDNNLLPLLGFKGGTAAKLFYNLDRFSVDLDFDLLDIEKQDYVFESILNILNKYGSVKEAEKKHFTLFFLLSYTNKKNDDQNVKIEINLRDFGSKYEIKSYLGISMNVMIKEDMFAHKLVAMYERMGKTSRDIYDVRFFLEKMWPINETIIKNRTNLSFEEFINKCILLLESVDNNKILSGLGELLSESQKDFIKAKLKIETIFLLKKLLENYLSIDK